jgi:hypothetical protein
VSILCKVDPRASPRTLNHPHHVAFRRVGPRPLGALQESAWGLTHLLVAVGKFTKWIEARPMAKIDSKQVVSFVLDIVFCFGVPNSIITDNGTQFTGKIS